MEDDAIRTLVTRLARPHPSGGAVIERAAVLAEGADSGAVMAWIIAHAGVAEAPHSGGRERGLHGSRITDGREAPAATPSRYVLPPGALTE